MATRDSEIDAMASILELMGPLEPQAQRRVATWIHARFAGSHVPGSTDAVDAMTVETAYDMKASDFVKLKGPKTKLERLLCLLFWAEAHGSDGGVLVRVLNELNRDVPGERFSDAASMAQAAISPKGYVQRVSPGRLVLTPQGREIVWAMPR
jgi:hypothetical protein